MTGDMVGHTVRLDVDREIEWWRPLVQWVVCIPHLLLTGALSAASLVVAIAIGVAVLFTGRVPRRLGLIQVMTLRERVRCYGYFFILRRTHPPFAFTLTAQDPGDDPAAVVSVVVPERLPRWSLVVRPLVLVPHLVVLVPIGAVMDACYPVWMVLASISKGWPPALARFLVAVERWVVALAAYGLFIAEAPPAFGLKAYGDVDWAPARA